jgi:hypothetical protein
MDLLAANQLGRAMYWDHYFNPSVPPNFARYIFLDNAARRFYPDWDLAADICVANLRTSAGKDPHDKGLHDLVGELSTRSDDFRRRWGVHNVRTHGAGVKHFHHHIVGDLTLAYESMDLQAEPDLTMTLYAAEPGSPTEDALRGNPGEDRLWTRLSPNHRPVALSVIAGLLLRTSRMWATDLSTELTAKRRPVRLAGPMMPSTGGLGGCRMA